MADAVNFTDLNAAIAASVDDENRRRALKCEICDHPIRSHAVQIVEHDPDPNLPPSVFAEPWTPPRIWRIATCGDDVCVFRAHHHGVPGFNYTVPA